MRDQQSHADDDQPLDKVDLARFLKVSKTKLDEMVREGSCPQPFKIGGQRRWRMGRIREWLRAEELIAEMKRAAAMFKKNDDGETEQERTETDGSGRKPSKGRPGAGGEPKQG